MGSIRTLKRAAAYERILLEFDSNCTRELVVSVAPCEILSQGKCNTRWSADWKKLELENSALPRIFSDNNAAISALRNSACRSVRTSARSARKCGVCDE